MKIENFAACYFPTAVVFVDDNRRYLDSIQIQLNMKQAWYRFFSDPVNAIEFLKRQKHDQFLNRAFLYQHTEGASHHQLIDIHVPAVHLEMYNPKRFDRVSVVVVDYAMPSMRGDELCRELKGLGFKIILLTGEADHRRATTLFNDGLIHHFLRKDEPHFFQVLNTTIREMQYAYFEEASKMIVYSLTHKPDAPVECLGDPAYLKFFSDFWQGYQFSEYYLLQENGTVVFLDERAHPSWLLIQEEEAMRTVEYEAGLMAEEIPADINAAIQKRQLMRFSFAEGVLPQKKEQWSNFVYPAKKIQGKSDYYYAYVEKPLMETDIEQDRILSFAEFRNRMRKAAE